jgi:hypothetical protein
MAYTAGDTITGDQYNIFVNNSSSPYGYNHFAGTGSGEYGLGQTHIATVSGGSTTITASQWNTLLTSMDNIASHTNDTLTSRTQVTAGDTIAIKSNLETDLATLAASVAGGSTSATALTTSTALTTVTTAAEGWNASATQEISVTFNNADEMRYYFNGGGKVRITVGVTAAVTDAKDTAFADLGTALGNLDIGAHATTSSGSTEGRTEDGLVNGFHDLTTSYTSLITLTSDNANYTSNTIEVSAKLDAAPGTATVMTIKMVATDPADDTTYTSPNTASPTVAAAVNDTPKMVTSVFTLTPNTSEGLGTAYGINTTAEVSNTTAD